jgi:hypothetical protein
MPKRKHIETYLPHDLWFIIALFISTACVKALWLLSQTSRFLRKRILSMTSPDEGITMQRFMELHVRKTCEICGKKDVKGIKKFQGFSTLAHVHCLTTGKLEWSLEVDPSILSNTIFQNFMDLSRILSLGDLSQQPLAKRFNYPSTMWSRNEYLVRTLPGLHIGLESIEQFVFRKWGQSLGERILTVNKEREVIFAKIRESRAEYARQREVLRRRREAALEKRLEKFDAALPSDYPTRSEFAMKWGEVELRKALGQWGRLVIDVYGGLRRAIFCYCKYVDELRRVDDVQKSIGTILGNDELSG